MPKRPTPAGFGGKKPKQRSPKRADDSGHSSAHAHVLGVLSEGEVEGLINGAQSIFFDETPALNSDNSQNFGDFSWDFRNGSEFQSAMLGYGDTVASETSIGAEVKFNLPVTRNITNSNLDIINVRLAFQLQRFKDNGDVEGNSIDFGIQIKEGTGAFIERYRQVISERYSSLTELEFEFPVNNQGGSISDFQVRVVRYTATATDEETDQKIIRWQTYSELIQVKLKYPFSALIGLRFDSTQFDNIPEMSFLLAGRTVQIPTNAQIAADRGLVFNGAWDGNFYTPASACSDPAWIIWDLLTNERYGLGKYINTASLDRYGMYEISRYCNEFVPDGLGGYERRFSCNVVLEGKEDAWKVLEAFRSIFRGVIYYQGSTIGFAADKPGNAEFQFNQAIAVDGKIERSRSSLTARKTVAKVTWNDPDDNYKRAIETVEDTEGKELYGYQVLEMSAFACTSRGQARRAGLAALITERIESETIIVKVGAIGAQLRPGMIIQFTDTKQANTRLGGLVLYGSNTTTILIDAPLEALEESSISVVLSDGTLETRPILTGASTQTTIIVSPPFSSAPPPETTWTIGTPTVEQELCRVLSIRPDPENNYQVFEVTAVLYRGDKFNAIELGWDLDPRITRRLVPLVVNPPTGAVISATAIPPMLFLAWQHPLLAGKRDQFIARYEVELKAGDSTWETVSTRSANRLEISEGLNFATDYKFRVRSINLLGNSSIWVESNIVQIPLATAPTNLRSIATESRLILGLIGQRPVLAWDLPASFPPQYVIQYEIQISNDGNTWVDLTATTEREYRPVPQIQVQKFYRVRVRDRWGNYSNYSNVFGFTPTPQVLSGTLIFEKEEMLLFNGKAEAFVTLSWSFPGHETEELTNRILLYEIDYRLSSEAEWTNAYADGLKRHQIGPVDGGIYDFRVRLQDIDGEYSVYTFLYNHQIAGKIAPPKNVENLRLIVTSDRTAQLSWEPATDLDVRIGGEVLIHHLQSGTNPDNSTLLAAVAGSADTKAVPLIDGTYLAKFKDSSGFLSIKWASISTSGVAAIQGNIIQAIVAHPLWNGSKNGFTINGSILEVERVFGWGVMGDQWSSIAEDWRSYAPSLSGVRNAVQVAYFELDERLILPSTQEVFISADLVYSAKTITYTEPDPLPDTDGLNIFIDGEEIAAQRAVSNFGFTTDFRSISITEAIRARFDLPTQYDLRSPTPGSALLFEAKTTNLVATDIRIGLKMNPGGNDADNQWKIAGSSADPTVTPVSTTQDGWDVFNIDLSAGMNTRFDEIFFSTLTKTQGIVEFRNVRIITNIYEQYLGVENTSPSTSRTFAEVKTFVNGVWSNWRQLISGSQRLGTQSQFRIVAQSIDNSVTTVERFSIKVDVPDRFLQTTVRTSAVTYTKVTFNPPFIAAPESIGHSVQNGETGDRVLHQNLTNQGVEIYVENKDGIGVSRTVLVFVESY